MPSALEFQAIDRDTLILKIYSSLESDKFDGIKCIPVKFLPVKFNSDTCLHGAGCADVHIVGTGHYADGFWWYIIYPYSGQWPLCGRVLLVPVCLHPFPLFRSLPEGENVFRTLRI